MDAYRSNLSDLTYSDEHPALLVASSDAAMERGKNAIEAANLRVGARLPVETACERIEAQPAVSVVWVELDRDCGDLTSRLFDCIKAGASRDRYGAVVSLTAESEQTLGMILDSASTSLYDSDVELIANADDVDRIAALTSVVVRRNYGESIAEAASDRSAERLRQLSEEVSRIASTLARLSAGPGAAIPVRNPTADNTDIPTPSGETVAAVIRARRLRARFFSEELFADPAWDMLLDLLQAEIRQLRVPVSSLCIAASVPATTALRWLKTLVTQGLFIRRADPHDGRRVFVELAPDASIALRRYFAEVGPVAVI
jgi:DNA-binding MarR family transcriptional regulator